MIAAIYVRATELGYEVRDASLKSVARRAMSFRFRPFVLHLHWIDHLFKRRRIGMLLGLLQIVALIGLVRARGGRVVWTYHNHRSHEMTRPRSEALARWLMLLVVNSVHAPSLITHDKLVNTRHAGGVYFELLAHQPSVECLNSVTKLGSAPAAIRLLCIGLLRPAKGIVEFASAFTVNGGDNLLLKIAGSSISESYGARLLSFKAANVEVRLGRLGDDEFIRHIDECDIVVLPYLSGWNSGVASTAMSRGKPIAVSALDCFARFKGRQFCYSLPPSVDQWPSFVSSMSRLSVDSIREAGDAALLEYESMVRQFDSGLVRLYSGSNVDTAMNVGTQRP